MRLIEDESPSVRIAAAEALAAHGSPEDVRRGWNVLVGAADARLNDYLVAVAALNAIDTLGAGASRGAELAALPRMVPGVNPRMNDYIDRLLKHIRAEPRP
jgi:uncharacterized sulfatase